MKTLFRFSLASLFLILMCAVQLPAQAPLKFNYQAVVRNTDGSIIADQAIGVRISIIKDSPGGSTVYSETHTPSTTSLGLINLVIGEGATAYDFSLLDWGNGEHYLKVEVDPAGGTSYTEMGTTQLMSVPYALYADDSDPQQLIIDGDNLIITDGNSVKLPGDMTFSAWTNDGDTSLYRVSGNVGVGTSVPSGKLEVQGDGTKSDSVALFEVKRSDGQPVFAVYPTGVQIFVEDGPGKSAKGGFAVGGFAGGGKGFTNEYLRVTPDSVRIYIDEESAKAAKGGFAVGGIGKTKGPLNEFMRITPENYFIGQQSGASITSGLYNSFMGYQSGFSTTDGERNIFLGYQSGLTNTLGYSNTFIGNNAGYSNLDGYSNVFIGDSSGFYNNGLWNIFIGNQAGFSNLDGSANIIMGDLAGYSNEYGDENVFLGDLAGFSNTDGSYNVFIGSDAGYSNETGDYNVFLGESSGSSNTTGNYNVFLGNESGLSSDTGRSNVFIGLSSGYSNIGGHWNVFMGTLSGYWNEIGQQNVFLGQEAGYYNSEGSYNVAIGPLAGYNNETGEQNVYIGQRTMLANTDGNYNIGLGSYAGYENLGSNNTFLGYATGYANTGSDNVFIGFRAGFDGLGLDGFKDSDMLIIDNIDNTIPETFIYGEFDNHYLYFYSDLEVAGNITYWNLWGTSDAKFKKGIQPYSNALDQVKQLQGVTYEWNEDAFKTDRVPEGEQIGLIAQDVEKVIPELVRTDRKGNMAINYPKLTTVLIEAMKEQQQMIEELQREVQELKAVLQ